jgi:hypothetical protein
VMSLSLAASLMQYCFKKEDCFGLLLWLTIEFVKSSTSILHVFIFYK